MKNTLEDRIKEFIKEYDKSHFLGRETVLERFLRDELTARQQEITIDAKQLLSMQDSATQAWQELPVNSCFYGDQKRTLAYCWTNAVLQYLRSNDLLHTVINVDKGVANKKE